MNDRPRVLYAREETVDIEEFRRVLVESGLGAIRPVDDPGRLRDMVAGANLIVTARLDRDDRPLIGIGRGISDGAWSCYLSELAVVRSAQGLGIGKGLLDEARRHLGETVALILVSVPESIGFYERAGMEALPHCFWYKRAR